jgi:hypothetical protein
VGLAHAQELIQQAERALVTPQAVSNTGSGRRNP